MSRWLLVVVVLASCGRIGFGSFGGHAGGDNAGDDDDDGSSSSGDGAITDATCASLGLVACQQTPGCAPEMCPTCPCGSVTFQACASIATAERPSCSALTCSCCGSNADCGMGFRGCAPVVVDPRCSKSCAGSAACSGVCGPLECDDLQEADVCLGCTSDIDCPIGDACSGNACVTRGCATDSDCTADEQCTGSGTCTATPCADDAQCFGSCIDGTCHSGAGDCEADLP
ncbi:MAG TPA: hypothetical protein VGG74_25915 [Kofleriaceae bacterium]